jgi:hypothetical protein
MAGFGCRYMELDINLYDRCSREHNEKERAKESQRAAAASKWSSITEGAAAKGVLPDPK